MTTNLHLQPNQPDDSILRERIRQAHWGFNLSLVFTSLSAVITVTGVVLLATGQLPQGSYATLGGLTSTAVGHRCVQLSRDANDRLDRLSREQDEVQEKP
ncbi:hypothetical protein [Leptolyngbya sp. CCY15150]|uniref:TRADD-N-associated membrane domain-containing protein n=1 Tax=Leptolyngbya sp. CCY15150 TaxID=2767772 RepID=UPI0019526932|nr:hypothetical protein [Leptolyngbya sp. CCY15150]